MPTGPRCCRCRRSRCIWAGATRIRLGRDYYVRLDTNDYSVDPTVIGRIVDVTADLDRVRVRAEGRVVADHARVWARGTTITDPAHVETAAAAAQAVPATPRRAGRRR